MMSGGIGRVNPEGADGLLLKTPDHQKLQGLGKGKSPRCGVYLRIYISVLQSQLQIIPTNGQQAATPKRNLHGWVLA